MKIVILTAVIAIMPILGFAHGDHAPKVAKCKAECTKTEVEQALPNVLQTLSGAGKVDASWISAKVEKVEQKEFKKGKEWVATLFDESQKEKEKKRLYIFITNKGYFNGSNFTGN